MSKIIMAGFIAAVAITLAITALAYPDQATTVFDAGFLANGAAFSLVAGLIVVGLYAMVRGWDNE